MTIQENNNMHIRERSSYLELSLQANHVASFSSLPQFLHDLKILQIHLPKLKRMRQPSGITSDLVGYLTIQG